MLICVKIRCSERTECMYVTLANIKWLLGASLGRRGEQVMLAFTPPLDYCFLAINLSPLENLFIPFLNGAIFLYGMRLWDEQQSWVYELCPSKICQICSANAEQIFQRSTIYCQEALLQQRNANDTSSICYSKTQQGGHHGRDSRKKFMVQKMRDLQK